MKKINPLFVAVLIFSTWYFILISKKNESYIPVEDFFRTPQNTSYKLSPDGENYIFGNTVNGINNIFIYNFARKESKQLTFSESRNILWFYWGNNNRVLYKQDNNGDENYKLYCININTSTTSCLTNFDNTNATLLDFYNKCDSNVLITLNNRNAALYDVYKLNIVTGKLQMIEKNPGNIRDWLVDNNGVVRIAYADEVLYRKDLSSAFKPFIVNMDKEDVFEIKYFAPDNKTIYAYSNVGRDKIAIVEFDLELNKEVNVLLEDSIFDTFGDDEVDNFYYSSYQQNLTHAYYTRDKGTLYFFDDSLKLVYDNVKNRIGNFKIQLASYTIDFSKIIFFVSSDKFEGSYYLYDKARDELNLISQITPWLDHDKMAEMKSISFPSRDGLTIHGYLTLPNTSNKRKFPVIINPHSGPQWRNSWRFDPFTQFFANRGYAVLQINYRGSEGYGKQFLQAGYKQWGLKMQDDITDGVNWLIKQGNIDKDRIAIFGWSYGGYAALNGLTQTPDIYCCGIDFWGPTNLFDAYNSFPQDWKPFMSQIHRRWFNPKTDSIQMRETSPIFYVNKIEAPLFITQSENDSRVKKQQSEQLVDSLIKYNKEYEYVLLKGEGHALSNEKKLIELMSRVEIFLHKHLE